MESGIANGGSNKSKTQRTMFTGWAIWTGLALEGSKARLRNQYQHLVLQLLKANDFMKKHTANTGGNT